MANEKISGKDIGLYYNASTTESPDWQLLVCLTENSLSSEVEVLEANSKCGTDASIGNESNTASFSGYTTVDPDSDNASANEIRALFAAKEYKEWVMTDDPDAPTFWRAFEGFISSLEESAPYDDSLTFDGEIFIRGSVDYEVPEDDGDGDGGGEGGGGA